jgi:hypothetical protein
MKNRQDYQSLVGMYKSGTQHVHKLGTFGMVIQIGIIGFIYSWKQLEIEYFKVAAPVLFSLSIYFLISDFLTLRRIEEKITQIILDGIELEKKDSSSGRFFHGVLQAFNFTSVLMQRSLANVLALGCLGYLMSQFISEIIPGFVVSRWMIGLFCWLPSVLALKLYYDSLKSLDEAKEQVFAK